MRCSSPTERRGRCSWCAPLVAAVACLAWAPLPVFGQTSSLAPATGTTAWTLESALRHALEHYPTVRAAVESVAASAAVVDIARAASLPRLDAVWQTNRATVNNVTGLLFPQSAVLSISGPPLPANSAQSVWGTATGALLTWEPWDFGLRRAQVASAEVSVARARADEGLTRLEVQSAVAAAFMSAAVAQRMVIVAQADVERRAVLARAARSLVESQLRPGAEASGADAERAAAATRLAQARQSLAIALSTLQRVLGAQTPVSEVMADILLALPPTNSATAPAPDSTTLAAAHPLTQARRSAAVEARAHEDELARAFVPRMFVLSSVFARGSGADPNGVLHGGADGLGLERPNWAAGVQFVLPNLFELPAIRARRAAAAATTRAHGARVDEAELLIVSQRQAAAAVVEAARAVAAETPLQLEAARQNESQARARFLAGLGSIVDVANAQHLLTQAEVQDDVAKVEVWRAHLAEAVARGSMEPFVSLVTSVGAR